MSNPYKKYLTQAKNRYHCNETIEDFLSWIKDRKENLRRLKESKTKNYNLDIKVEKSEEFICIYSDDLHWREMIDLLIGSCEYDLKLMKAMVYDMLENGELFNDEEVF